MPLVDYSSSDDSENNVDGEEESSSSPHSLKRKRDILDHENEAAADLPPLPSQFHDLYASTTRTSTRDDPSLHGGRKRATPHVEGNWPTHLYIEWYPQPAEYNALNQLIAFAAAEDMEGKITSFLTSDLSAPLPLHISLSRPIGFKTEEKDGFISTLQRRVAACGVRPFEVQPMNLDWVPNFEATRWFLVLRLKRPAGDGLNKLLRVCNTVVGALGQGVLYAKPSQPNEQGGNKRRKTSEVTAVEGEEEKQDLSDSFHVSIAWTLEEPSEEVMELARASAGNAFENVKGITFRVDEIKAKVGNVITTVKLPLKVVEGPNLFGF